MKIILIVFSCFVLISCSDSPKKVAKKFFENIHHGELQKCKKFATESVGRLIDNNEVRHWEDPDYKCKIIKEKIDGNRAIVTLAESGYRDIGGEMYKDTVTAFLVKIDGVWKCTFESK